MKRQKEVVGVVEMKCIVAVKVDISMWDALKMRMMGRRPAAILIHRLADMLKKTNQT